MDIERLRALEKLDEAFEAEIRRVSTVQYNSNEICRHFFGQLRAKYEALIAELGQEVGADWSDWFETWAKARGMTMQLTADGRFLCPDTALAQSAHEAGCMVSHMYYMELCRQEELAKTSPAHTSEARDLELSPAELESLAKCLVASVTPGGFYIPTGWNVLLEKLSLLAKRKTS